MTGKVKRKMQNWYAVKSVYQVKAAGRPKSTDSYYAKDLSLIEERVVIIRAGNPNEALKLGRKEALLYAKESYTNPYGQKVSTRLLGLDAFKLYESPKCYVEVYAATFDEMKSKKANAILDDRLGKLKRHGGSKYRRKFWNSDLK